MKKICVYGSINADYFLEMDSLPEIGENTVGNDYHIKTGGKGANQAVACAKLGANVSFISLVGYDETGMRLVEKLRRAGVGVRFVGRYPMKTGINFIVIDKNRKKSMLFFTESNSKIDADYLARCTEAIDNAQLLLLGLSVPMDGILAAAKRMKQQGGKIILDPSPAKPMSDELLAQIDFITPNEKELSFLSGVENACSSDELRKSAADVLLEKGVGCVIVKSGKDGAYIIDKNTTEHVKAFDVKFVDDTGVGSAFNGAFAVSIARKDDVSQAVRFANAACALTIARGGSQDSMPNYDDCNDLLHGRYVFD